MLDLEEVGARLEAACTLCFIDTAPVPEGITAALGDAGMLLGTVTSYEWAVRRALEALGRGDITGAQTLLARALRMASVGHRASGW